MNGKVLVLCDTEKEYAQQMSEFIKSHKDLPWEIRTYTNVEGLVEFMEKEPVEMLVVAENAYTEEVRQLSVTSIILLNESGTITWGGIKNVDKYQQAENVWKEILCTYLEIAGSIPLKLSTESSIRLIGIYSPIRRCLQTSFALTLGQILADRYRTLYLNFEHYAGITELLPDIQTRDLADLLYFLTAEKEKFSLWMRTMMQKKGKLDYIPPMRTGQNLIQITSTEWSDFLRRISGLGEYEYVILDLSENIQGLFDILRMCYKVFTLTKDDKIARSKIIQYEQVLALYEFEDVLVKTCKCDLPLFRKLPEQIEQFTRGELADYVKRLIEEVFV